MRSAIARTLLLAWLLFFETASDARAGPVCSSAGTRLVAFPGAEGFGAKATGGRGGRVVRVTTLKARGRGSLDAALRRKGPRIIVFTVSGVIEGDFVIRHGNVTIAGQTAPGAGVTIRGRLSGAYDRDVRNIVIRHLRIRPPRVTGDGAQWDALQLSKNSVIVLDHLSVAFGVDETVDLYEARDVTIQWSSIESSATEGHPEKNHNFGLISGPDGRRVSIHHNLFAHHRNRAPAVANGPAEVVNNVIYNVRHGFQHHNPASGSFNIVGNYFRRGPSSPLFPFYFDDEDEFAGESLSYFVSDNYVDDAQGGLQRVVENPWKEIPQDLRAPEKLRAEKIHVFRGDCYVPVSRDSASRAFERVLESAGAWPRDVVTKKSVEDTKSGTGRWGVYSAELTAGLRPATAPADRDRDGISDAWELAHGLSPRNRRDYRKQMPSGYTAIEEYINELAAQLEGGRQRP